MPSPIPAAFKDYATRLDYELGVIKKTGFAGYFLIVADFIAYARRSGIPVGPGRGSAAGSLVAWSLGITGVDKGEAVSSEASNGESEAGQNDQPAEAGPPADVGRPPEASPPADAGPPADPGPPVSTPKPEVPGPPDTAKGGIGHAETGLENKP